jgi:hypothetical protein
MKSHSVLTTKDEQLAQEVGIAVARSMFKDHQNPKYQTFLFSWKTFGTVVADMAASKLFVYFRALPKNYTELQAITSETVLIEWDILVSNSPDSLPVATFTVDEIIEQSKQYFHRFYETLEKQFMEDYVKQSPTADALDWKVVFNHLHTPVYVYNKGIEKLESIVRERGFTVEESDTIFQNVRPYLKRLYIED